MYANKCTMATINTFLLQLYCFRYIKNKFMWFKIKLCFNIELKAPFSVSPELGLWRSLYSIGLNVLFMQGLLSIETTRQNMFDLSSDFDGLFEFYVWKFRLPVSYTVHKRRIYTEEKAKVVAAVDRIDSIPCRASYFAQGRF